MRPCPSHCTFAAACAMPIARGPCPSRTRSPPMRKSSWDSSVYLNCSFADVMLTGLSQGLCNVSQVENVGGPGEQL